jgi:hypothetical protein
MKTFREYYHETNVPNKALKNKKSVILDKQTFDEGLFTSTFGDDDATTGSAVDFFRNITLRQAAVFTGRVVGTGAAIAAASSIAPPLVVGIAAARAAQSGFSIGRRIYQSFRERNDVDNIQFLAIHGCGKPNYISEKTPALLAPSILEETWDANKEEHFPRGLMTSLKRSGPAVMRAISLTASVYALGSAISSNIPGNIDGRVQSGGGNSTPDNFSPGGGRSGGAGTSGDWNDGDTDIPVPQNTEINIIPNLDTTTTNITQNSITPITPETISNIANGVEPSESLIMIENIKDPTGFMNNFGDKLASDLGNTMNIEGKEELFQKIVSDAHKTVYEGFEKNSMTPNEWLKANELFDAEIQKGLQSANINPTDKAVESVFSTVYETTGKMFENSQLNTEAVAKGMPDLGIGKTDLLTLSQNTDINSSILITTTALNSQYYQEANETGIGRILPGIFGTDAGYSAAKRKILLDIVDKTLDQIVTKFARVDGSENNENSIYFTTSGLPMTDPKQIRASMRQIIETKLTRDIVERSDEDQEGDQIHIMYKKLMERCGFKIDDANIYKPIDTKQTIIDTYRKEAEAVGKAKTRIQTTAKETKKSEEEVAKQTTQQQQNANKFVSAIANRAQELRNEIGTRMIAQAGRSELFQTAVKQEAKKQNLPDNVLEDLLVQLKNIEKQIAEIKSAINEDKQIKKAAEETVTKEPVETEVAPEDAPEDAETTKPAKKKFRSKLNSVEFKMYNGKKAKIPMTLKTGLKNIGKSLLANPKTHQLLKDIGLTSNTVTVGLADDGGIFLTEEFLIEVESPTDGMLNKSAQSAANQTQEPVAGAKPTAPVAPVAQSKEDLMSGAVYGSVRNVNLKLDSDQKARQMFIGKKQIFKTVTKVMEKLINKAIRSDRNLKKQLQDIGLGTFDGDIFKMNGRFVLYMSPGKKRKKIGEGETPTQKKYIVFEDIFNEDKDYITVYTD